MNDLQERQELFIKKASNNPHLKIIGEYINCETDVLCECVYCNENFKMKPERIYKNCMHQKCTNIFTANLRKERGYKKLLDTVGEDLEFTTEYISAIKPIGCKCKKCGYEFNGYPNNLIKGQRCKKCFFSSITKTHETFMNEIKDKIENIEILSEYKGGKIKIKCRCKIDGYEWETLPRNIIKGHGCPMCSGNARYGFDYFVSKLKEINTNIEISGEYVNAHTHLKCMCKLCGHEWEATPNNLLNGRSCPYCNISNAENSIQNYLERNLIDFEQQKKYDELLGLGNGHLSYDFYVPSYNLLIEAQGQQHYMPVDFFGGQEYFEIQKEHDKRKRNYAKDHNIELLEISYLNFGDIENILNNKFLIN